MFNPETSNCGTCKYWVRLPQNEALKTCVAASHIDITGPKFFCANWEKNK